MTTYLTVDAVAKLQKTLDFITDHPERHHQETWMAAHPVDEFGTEVEPDMPNGCGTYGCVAGWLVMHNLGGIPEHAWLPIRKYDHTLGRHTDEIVGYDFDYSAFSVVDAAREALGLEYGDELLDSLFYSDRTLPEIWFVAQQLADGRLSVPAAIEPVNPDGYYYYYDEDERCACGCGDDED
jgi:hypothetical protein